MNPPRQDTPIGVARPDFDRIPRRMAVFFGAIIAVLMMTVLVAGGAWSMRLAELERDQLLGIVNGTMTSSVQSMMFSGRHHTAQLLQEQVDANPGLLYARVVAPDGSIIAEAGAAPHLPPQDGPWLDGVLLTLESETPDISERTIGAVHIHELHAPLRGGFDDGIVGVLAAGVRTESRSEALRHALIPVGGLVLILLIAAIPAVTFTSRRLGAPVQQLALEFDAILAQTPLLVGVFDRDGRTLRASARLSDMLTVQSGPAAQLRSLLPPLQAGDAGRPVRTEVTIPRKDGDHIYLVDIFPLSDLGHTRCLIAADITALRRTSAERDKLQAQLLHAQKLEAVGRLAGGVAHDFNNLLTVINGAAELALLTATLDDRGTQSLVAIQSAGDRAAVLTRQLLAFSRRQVLHLEPLDLTRVVQAFVPMIRRLIGEGIEINVNAPDGQWLVHADRGQVDQVLMNLAINAADAMPQGGTLVIDVANRWLDEQTIRTHETLVGGEYVVLSVSDTGHGISPAYASKIFEPFFSTKAPGKGTGLGLATVHGIIRQSQGHIWLHSEESVGTTFRIALPRDTDHDEATSGPIEVPATASPTGDEHILVVEDDDQVRRTIVAMLQDAGYATSQASDGDSALQRLTEMPSPPDLVLSDLVMPGMGGPELVQRIQVRWPAMPALFMSGYSAEMVDQVSRLPDGDLLTKPPSMHQLRVAVRRAIDRNRADT